MLGPLLSLLFNQAQRLVHSHSLLPTFPPSQTRGLRLWINISTRRHSWVSHDNLLLWHWNSVWVTHAIANLWEKSFPIASRPKARESSAACLPQMEGCTVTPISTACSTKFSPVAGWIWSIVKIDKIMSFKFFYLLTCTGCLLRHSPWGYNGCVLTIFTIMNLPGGKCELASIILKGQVSSQLRMLNSSPFHDGPSPLLKPTLGNLAVCALQLSCVS